MVSYKKLWKLLIDKDMTKTQMGKVARLSPTTVAKLTKGENVQTDILVRICNVLGCGIEDIMEITPSEGGRLDDR